MALKRAWRELNDSSVNKYYQGSDVGKGLVFLLLPLYKTIGILTTDKLCYQ